MRDGAVRYLPAGRQGSRNDMQCKIKYTIYVLKSFKNGRLYIGMTTNLPRRLIEHNRGDNKSSKSNRPYKVIYTESVSNRDDARSLEKKFKSGCWREKFKSMHCCGVEQSGSSRGS